MPGSYHQPLEVVSNGVLGKIATMRKPALPDENVEKKLFES